MVHRTAHLKLGTSLDTPDAKRAYNALLFEEVAPRYDLITRILSLGRDASWKRDLIGVLPTFPAPVCVDLACGTGDITRGLAQHFQNGTVTGIDLTASMLEIARQRDPHGRAAYREADMCATGLADHSVDVVTGGYALRNAPNLSTALQEIRRILKPQGYGAFLDFSKPVPVALQKLEYGILKFWGCLWGLLLHGNPAVYGYIADSLAKFPDRAALNQILKAHGFIPGTHKRFMCGAIELVCFTVDPDYSPSN